MLFTDKFLTERRNNFMDQIGEFWYYIESTDNSKDESGWLKCTEQSRKVSGYYITFILELPQVLNYNHKITTFNIYRKAEDSDDCLTVSADSNSAVPVTDPAIDPGTSGELIGTYNTEYSLNSYQTLDVVFRILYQENQVAAMSNVIINEGTDL